MRDRNRKRPFRRRPAGEPGEPGAPRPEEEQPLRGGCAFSPRSLDRRLWRLDEESAAPLAAGGGELEFVPPAAAAEESPPPSWRESSRTGNFTPEELRAVCDGLRFREPAPRPDARLVLLEVSPRLAHAYWEIGPETIARLRREHGAALDEAALVLRFYELAFLGSEETVQTFDLDVHGLQNNWFAHLEPTGACYVTALGFRLPDGAFAEAARSNPVRLPAGHPAAAPARNHMHVAANRAGPVTPPVPAPLRTESPRPVSLLDLDDPGRDLQAERHVRDVYLRVLAEGPRVLSGRPPLRPRTAEERRADYRARQLEAEAAADARAAGEEPSAPPSAPADAGVRTAPPRIEATPAARLPRTAGDERQAEDRRRHAMAIAVSMAVGDAERKAARARPLAAAPEAAPAPTARLQPAAEPLSVANGSRIRPRRPVDLGPAPHLQAPAAAPSSPPSPAPAAEDPFLAGLGVEAGPEPPRPAVAPARKSPAGPARGRDYAAPTAESFLAGLDLGAPHPAPAAKPPAAQPPAPQPGRAAVTTEEEAIPDAGDAEAAAAEPATERPAPPPAAPAAEALTADVAAHAPAEEETAPHPAGSASLPASRSETPAPPARPERLRLAAKLVITGEVPAGTSLELDGRELPVDEAGRCELECTIEEGHLRLPVAVRHAAAPETREEITVDLSVEHRAEHAPWERIRILPPRRPRQG